MLTAIVAVSFPSFGINIEQAQRAAQERYEMATGNTWTWPGRSDGEPAPAYPQDGFYGDDLTDPEKAAGLVANLALLLSNEGFIDKFVSAEDGDIDGMSQIQFFSTGDQMPPVAVTTPCYAEQFKVLVGYIQKLKYLYAFAGDNGQGRMIQAGATAPQFDLTKPCSEWLTLANNSYSQNIPRPESFRPIGIEDLAEYRENYFGSTFVVVGIFQTRGFITANLAGMKGKAVLYLKIKPRSHGTSSANPAPIAADEVFHKYKSVSAGGPIFEPLGFGQAQASVCPQIGGGSNIIFKGWAFSEGAVIVTPDFLHPVAELNDCEACQEKACKAGQATASTSSLMVRYNLGKADFGRAAGQLLLKEEAPSALLTSPDALKPTVDEAVQLINTTNGLRQVKAPEGLADIVTINPAKYEIRFFLNPNVGATNAAGLYQPSGSPSSIVAIESLNGTNSFNQIRVTQTDDGTPKVSDFEYTPASGTWKLTTGGGLRKESRSSVTNGPNRTDTVTISDANDQVVHKRIEQFHTFDWGEEKVQEVLDPDGAALTTSWSFYDNAGYGSNYRHLREVVRPTGYWERYEYDQFGRKVKTVAQFLDAPLGSGEGSCRVTSTSYSDADPAVTVTQTLLGQEISRTYTVHRPGETRTIQARASDAAWDDPDNLVSISKTYLGGQFQGEIRSIKSADGTMSLYEYAAANGQKTTTVSTGEPSADESAVVSGTRTVTVVDIAGNVLSETKSDIATGLLLSSAVATQTDDVGRPTRIEYNDGTVLTRTYGCCGIESEADREGVATTFLHDALGRVIAQSRDGITMLYTYDAQGNVLKTIRKGTDDSEITLDTTTYDLAGRRTSSRNALNFETTFNEIFDGNGHAVKTTTFPGGSTRIEIFTKDGSLMEIAGTAAHPLLFEYGVEASGPFTREFRIGDGGSQDEWVQSLTDFFGRNYKTVFPDGASTEVFFNNKGQTVKSVDPDGVTVLFEYNGRGEQEIVALDMDRNGVIDFGGTDRITRLVRDVASAHGTTVYRTTTTVWATEGADVPSTLSVEESSADGLQSWNTTLGLTTHSQAVLNGSGNRTVTVTRPDGSSEISQFEDGRPTSLIRKDASNAQIAAIAYSYDAHHRQTAITDARNGPTTVAYNDLDQVTATTRSGQTTSFVYDSRGRRTHMTLPDGGVVANEYFDTGELKKASGARTYTTEYTYDTQGRLKTLLAGSGTTTWNYTPQRGLVSSKVYADGKGPSYTYTLGTRLESRLWARGITTTYTYNSAGELGVIDYSDATPDVAQNYDRLGRISNVSDAAGMRTLSYNLVGRLLNETYSGGVLDGVQINRTYALDRLATLSADHPTAGALTFISYGYDGASRLSTVSDGTHSATYSYHPNSSLVASVTSRKGAATTLTVSKQYDLLDRLTSIANIPANDATRSFTYTYNDANQRTRVDLEDGSYWLYGYDSLGQVTSGKKYFSDNTPVPGQQFDYAFDGNGNRTVTTTNGRLANYAVNDLNQYTQREVPGAFDVFGTAKADATVTVNNQLTLRKGEFFYKELLLDNASAPAFDDITVVGVKNGVGPNNEDSVTEKAGSVYLPKTPEVFTYDDDGNLLSDGRWNYAWDGENRLTGLESVPDAPEGARRRVSFLYDHEGRRIVKNSETFDSGSWMLQASTRSIYDRWNLMAELGSPNGATPLRAFTWGTGLGESLDRTGGVGGLLFARLTAMADIQSYCYDGGGNVSAIVGMDNGKIMAEYEYSPFGKVIRQTGSLSAASPQRFSTKLEDSETGMLYYGLRYYHPDLGRWPTRDPLEELGGSNLYGFVGNCPIHRFDQLGLEIQCEGCGLDDYLKGLGFKIGEDYTRKFVGKTDAVYKGFTFKVNGEGENVIIQQMLKSQTVFKIAGSDKDEIEKNIKHHVEVRQRVVRFARGLKVSWPQPGDQETFAKCPEGEDDSMKYYDELNNPDTKMKCALSTRLVFYGAIGGPGNELSRTNDDIFIPGDRFYLINDAWRMPPWSVGYEGENLIVVGIDSRGEAIMWGRMRNAEEHSLGTWKAMIRDAWPAGLGLTEKGRPVEWPHIRYPSPGLKP